MSDAAPQAKTPQVVRSHRAMDTAFTITIQSADAVLATSAAEAAFARIDVIEGLLSRFNDTSDVALIAALRPGEVGVVALETMCALTASARVCEATGGAFDPTVGPVMRRLKKTGMAWDAIPPDVLEDAFARGGMQRLVLDVEHLRVSVKADRLGRDTPLELDFGGIGKGVALDNEVAKVSIVGAGMETHAGVAAKMFEALYGAHINIRMISTSEIKISVLIDSAQGEAAMRAVHRKFFEE